MITGRTVLISEKLLKPLKLSKNSIKTNKDPLEYIRIDKKRRRKKKDRLGDIKDPFQRL